MRRACESAGTSNSRQTDDTARPAMLLLGVVNERRILGGAHT